METSVETKVERKKSMMDVFAEGARDGMNVILNVMAPNTCFAYALIVAMNVTGLMDLIGTVFGPLMGIFGLPGESAAALVVAFLSCSSGLGAAAALVASGLLTASHVAIILPGIMIMGSAMQFIGRVLGPSGLNSKYWGLCIGVTVFDSFLSMLIMNLIV